MTAFDYRAADARGRTRRGVIDAAGPSEARDKLRARDLLPIDVTPAGRPEAGAAPARGARGVPRLFRKKPVSGRELALFCRQMATLTRSDVRIEDALAVIARQMRARRPAGALLSVRAAVMEGRSLASALSDFPDAFPEYFRTSVAAGETSGRLGEVLGRLAGFVEMREANRRRIRMALVYPALLTVVAGGMIVLLLTYVVPDIVRVFQARGAELPFLTRALIGLSESVRAYGLWALAAALAALAVFRRWAAAEANRLRLHEFSLKTPVISAFSRHLNSARYAGTLATLVQSGAPLLDSMRTAAAAAPNHHVRRQAARAAERVGEGESLQAALAGAGCFPPLLVAMAASGESGGDLGDALAHAAKDQQDELDGWVGALVSLVEPGVLLIMGGVILLMVMAILMPIVGLNELAGF
jgi:general secretion pathway protein F